MPEQFRTSVYTIYVKLPETSEFLTVHGYTGAIDLVQPNVVEFLRSFGKPHQKATVTESTRELLQQRGYLTDKTPEEEHARVRELAETFHKHQLKAGKGFLFVPAYDCNFNCPYCYEAAVSRNGTGWTKEVMTKEMVDAAYVAIRQLEPDVNRCKKITLYGAEPLLARNYEIVKYILEQGYERGHTFAAITNGYELEAYRDFVNKGKIESLQITLDGPPEIHDRTRKLHDGSGTFNRIAANITHALQAGIRVTVRVNTDQRSVGSLPELVDIVKAYEWLDGKEFTIYAAPTHSGGRLAGHDPRRPLPHQCSDVNPTFRRSQFVKTVLQQKEQFEQLRVMGDDDYGIKKMIKAVLSKGSLFPFKSVFCGSNTGMFIFDPRGEVYTCWEFVGQEHGRVGRFWPTLDIDDALLAQWRGRSVTTIPQCRACKYALFCGGGCEAFAYEKYGCFSSSYCDDYPAMFSKFAATAYQEFIQEQSAWNSAVVPDQTNNQSTPINL
ncbi:MAG: SPASM domain-containing protein [Ignavibacteria bacterium]|nr:SPASM domain-containing protein [Ignavibacteria bacterium]